MPQINLLITSSSKKKKAKSLEAPVVELTRITAVFLPIAYVTIAILIIIWLSLSFVILKYTNELALLEKKKNSLTASPQELKEINLKKEQLTNKAAILDELSSRKFFWADRLGRIAEFIPEGIWLTEIFTEKALPSVLDAKKDKSREKTKTREAASVRYTLILKGSAFAYKIQDAVDLIGRFNNLLKKDENFSNDFSEIKLINVAKSAIGKTDIMDFEFNLPIK